MNVDALLNDFAVRCFRDVADHDYISARMAYRAGLFSQFYWSGLQAVEKYLKAILLFNRVKARDVKHDLARALMYAERLPFRINLSAEAAKLVDHLDRFGRYRYLESSYFIHGPKLVELDRAVWEIRRYCTVLDYRRTDRNGEERSMLSHELARIEQSTKEPPHRFRLAGGRLENIVANEKSRARKPLIWQNMYFCRSKRTRVRMVVPFHATNSPLSLHPEILDEVLKYVFLPNEVVTAYRGS